ncbi:MAG: hypothetical protein K6D90_03170 [Lachnospiraceae bacterium]|nr:hypothetical protein [Lachnospiraceae bacterium]
MAFDHEEEAFLGHTYTETTLSFGLESKKLNKRAGNYSYDMAGGKAKGTVGDHRKGASISGELDLGHAEFSYEIDYMSPVPKASVKAEGDLARLKAKAAIEENGFEHQVASMDAKVLGASFSAGAGGTYVLPSGKAEAHAVKVGAGFGIDGLPIQFSILDGPQASVKADLDKPWEKIIGVENKGETDTQLSAKVDGLGGVKGIGSGGMDFKDDLGLNSISNFADYRNSITERAGTATGTPAEINAGERYRKNLAEDAQKQYKKNEKQLDRIEGKHSVFSNRKNNRIADTSRGYVDRLDAAIDRIADEKQSVLPVLSDPQADVDKKLDAERRFEKLDKEEKDLTEARDHLVSDMDRANANLNRFSEYEEVSKKPTAQIVSDAKNNAQSMETAVAEKGVGNHLAEPATDICGSRNELNGRMRELDRRIGENNRSISRLEGARQSYLQHNGMTLKDAVDRNDQVISAFNEHEKLFRSENGRLREEKGECQKALLETDKNFMPRQESAAYESKARTLEANRIDNENARAAQNDRIATYCNEKGIGRGENNTYYTEKGQPDPALQNLLHEQEGLEKEGQNCQNRIDDNKRDLAKSERFGKSSLTVAEKDGNADIKASNDNYKDRARDIKDLRGNQDSVEERSPQPVFASTADMGTKNVGQQAPESQPAAPANTPPAVNQAAESKPATPTNTPPAVNQAAESKPAAPANTPPAVNRAAESKPATPANTPPAVNQAAESKPAAPANTPPAPQGNSNSKGMSV